MQACSSVIFDFLQSKGLFAAERALRTELEASFHREASYRKMLERNLWQSQIERMLEVKLHVAMGELSSGLLYELPSSDWERWVRLERIDGASGAFECTAHGQGFHGHLKGFCASLRDWLPQVIVQLARAARRVHEAYAADWLRLDAFAVQGRRDERGHSFVVNELTYPSNAVMGAPDAAGLGLARAYREGAYSVVPAREVMRPLLRRIDIEWDELVAASDWRTLAHTTDDEYDLYTAVWPRWTPKGPASSSAHLAALFPSGSNATARGQSG